MSDLEFNFREGIIFQVDDGLPELSPQEVARYKSFWGRFRSTSSLDLQGDAVVPVLVQHDSLPKQAAPVVEPTAVNVLPKQPAASAKQPVTASAHVVPKQSAPQAPEELPAATRVVPNQSAPQAPEEPPAAPHVVPKQSAPQAPEEPPAATHVVPKQSAPQAPEELPASPLVPKPEQSPAQHALRVCPPCGLVFTGGEKCDQCGGALLGASLQLPKIEAEDSLVLAAGPEASEAQAPSAEAPETLGATVSGHDAEATVHPVLESGKATCPLATLPNPQPRQPVSFPERRRRHPRLLATQCRRHPTRQPAHCPIHSWPWVSILLPLRILTA